MSGLDGRIFWARMLSDTRGWLGLEDGQPVPADELIQQLQEEGYTEREATEMFRNCDCLEHAGGSLENPDVLLEEGDV